MVTLTPTGAVLKKAAPMFFVPGEEIESSSLPRVTA
jgi:hypothetical protein